MEFSIIIPAKNESLSLKLWLPALVKTYPKAQIIVINDGSTDDTGAIAAQSGAQVINLPYSLGNGAAIKTGARAAKFDTLIMMDADGQHQIKDIPVLLDAYKAGYDMVIGCRDPKGHANFWRKWANKFYNFLASLIVGHPVKDLTSGFRIVNATKFRSFLHLLPNGFSYPTTITMAFFRSGYTIKYTPIHVIARVGKSHIRPIRDGLKFLLIIYKMSILYSPCKIFTPISILHIFLGLLNYYYTYSTVGRFTNMSGVLITAGIIIFLIGIVSDQITSLMYQRSTRSDSEND